MKVLKISQRASKRVYKALNRKQHQVLINNLHNSPRESLLQLIGAGKKMRAMLDNSGKNQFHIMAAVISSIIEAKVNSVKDFTHKHPSEKLVLELADLSTAQKVGLSLIYWVLIAEQQVQNENGSEACDAALADLKVKLDAVTAANEAHENCQKGLQGGGIGSDIIPQVLGADEAPGLGAGGEDEGDCSGEKSTLDSAFHDLEVAINNLPLACG